MTNEEITRFLQSVRPQVSLEELVKLQGVSPANLDEIAAKWPGDDEDPEACYRFIMQERAKRRGNGKE